MIAFKLKKKNQKKDSGNVTDVYTDIMTWLLSSGKGTESLLVSRLNRL